MIHFLCFFLYFLFNLKPFFFSLWGNMRKYQLECYFRLAWISVCLNFISEIIQIMVKYSQMNFRDSSIRMKLALVQHFTTWGNTSHIEIQVLLKEPQEIIRFCRRTQYIFFSLLIHIFHDYRFYHSLYDSYEGVSLIWMQILWISLID